MTASHRKWHVRLWAVLLPLVLLGVVVALAQRETRPVDNAGEGGVAAP